MSEGETRLPNYSKYLDSLRLYAKAVNIKIIYRNGDFDGGQYYHHTRIMSLQPDLSEATEIAVILHEFGHALDEVSVISNNKLCMAYDAYYNDRHTKNQIQMVRQCELRAWKGAVITAKLLKIPLGKWFYKEKAYCLRTYK